MTELTLYTKDNCIQCKMTKKYLDRCHLQYKTINVSQDSQARQELKDQGFSSVPLLFVGNGDEVIVGFAPGKLAELEKRLENAI